MKHKLIATLALTALMGIAGCERSGPAERLGERIDDATEEIGDTVDDACEDIKEAAGADNDNC